MSNDPLPYREIFSFNRYSYANNNPYRYTDPTGMIPVIAPVVIGGGIGALILIESSTAATGGDLIAEGRAERLEATVEKAKKGETPELIAKIEAAQLKIELGGKVLNGSVSMAEAINLLGNDTKQLAGGLVSKALTKIITTIRSLFDDDDV